MEIQSMNFKNDELDVAINAYINKNNEIWFRGKEIASILGYKDTKRAIQKHVHEDDKKLIDFKIPSHAKSPNSSGDKTSPQAQSHETTRKCFFINESGFYSLILSSKLPLAKDFKRWVTKEVLPSIRKRGYYVPKPYNNVIETENDLHYNIVSFIRKKYPEALMIAGLGENQTTEATRIESWKKGYMAGQCDLMLLNPTSKFNSLCIELKDPKGHNLITDKQKKMKDMYIKNKCKYIVSRSVTDVCYEIIKHMDESERYIKRRTLKSLKIKMI